MFGVSPAYFFSKYTTSFTVEDYAKGLDSLHTLGFKGYQLEIFYKEKISEWLDNSHLIARKANDLGMSATQFVAHFLLFTTANEESLLSENGYEEMKQVVEIVKGFPGCNTVTLPISPFSYEASAGFDKGTWDRIWNGLCTKLLRMNSIVEDAGLRLALEIVPGSLLGGTEGLLRLSKETGNNTIGYNFDTGHAWSCKENIATIPAKLAGRIYGTHLKDNFGYENLALPPGDGSIPWEAVMASLQKTGYAGSYDLEIASKDPSKVSEEYLRGKAKLETLAGKL
jgi:sugar phosphate isomerase/epimerase